MKTFSSVLNNLADYVIDASFSNEGRLACSLSSNKILIFGDASQPTLAQSVGIGDVEKFSRDDWRLEGAIAEAHRELITRLSWADTRFGQVIGSCSLDGTASIWCQARRRIGLGVNSFTERGDPNSTDLSASAADLAKPWVRAATFNDSQSALTCIKFCPCQFGFRFAVSCEDGDVLVYSADDVLLKDVWYFEVLPATPSDSPAGCTALDWAETSTGSFESEVVSPVLVLGCTDGSVRLWRRSATKWQHVQTFEACREWVTDIQTYPQIGGVSLSWQPLIAISSSNSVGVWRLEDQMAADNDALLTPVVTFRPNVPATRVAWSGMGQVLAVALHDGTFEFWMIAQDEGTAIPLLDVVGQTVK